MCFYKVRSKLYFKHQRTEQHLQHLFSLSIARGMSLNKTNIFINKGIHHVLRHSPGWTLINELLVSCECKAWDVHLSHLDPLLRGKSSSIQSCKTEILKTQGPNSPCYHREWAWTTLHIIPACMQKNPSTNNQKWVLCFIHSDEVVAEGSFERERHLFRGEYFFQYFWDLSFR